VLPCGFWYGVSIVSGVGSQMRVTPAGFSTSTRVVISNVRHRGSAVDCPKRLDLLDSAKLADTSPAWRRKSRRSIDGLRKERGSCPVTKAAHVINAPVQRHNLNR